MRVGYVRVSTIEQNEERQIIDLKENGHVEKIFIDKLSGKDTNRPQFLQMLDFVREGDVLVVSEYSRLARSTKDLLNTIDALKAKGVEVVSMKEKLDTSTPQGQFMLTVFAGVCELERAIILQRTREGVAIAKAKGLYKGRQPKKKPKNWNELYDAYMHRQMTATKLAQECKVCRPVLYKWLREEREKERIDSNDVLRTSEKDNTDEKSA